QPWVVHSACRNDIKCLNFVQRSNRRVLRLDQRDRERREGGSAPPRCCDSSAQRAHSKLQAASHACLTAARRLPRLMKNSEGAMCSRRDAEQSGAAQGGFAAEPTDRRIVSL